MKFNQQEYQTTKFSGFVNCECSTCCDSLPRLKRDIATDLRLGRSSWRCKKCRSSTVVHLCICKHCHLQFQAPTKDYKFCGHSCAAKYINPSRLLTRKARKRVIQTLRKFSQARSEKLKLEPKVIPPRPCKHCKCSFVSSGKTSTFCSVPCWKEFHRLRKPAWRIYSEQCAFKFNVYDYPDYFDIELLNRYGWYSPSNKNNNLNGVSRDHCISVKWGFDNGIDPKLISHPANCRLVRHTDNQLKSFKCSITPDLLKQQIDRFHEQYPTFPK